MVSGPRNNDRRDAAILKNWSHKRARDMSGSDGWKERKQAEKWAKGYPIRGRKRWRPSKRMRSKIARGEV
jgi:hypothetical protein